MDRLIHFEVSLATLTSLLLFEIQRKCLLLATVDVFLTRALFHVPSDVQVLFVMFITYTNCISKYLLLQKNITELKFQTFLSKLSVDFVIIIYTLRACTDKCKIMQTYMHLLQYCICSLQHCFNIEICLITEPYFIYTPSPQIIYLYTISYHKLYLT